MTATILVLVAGLTALGVAGVRRPARRDAALRTLVVAGLGFQVVHLVEHGVQAAVWVGARDEPPFLTPWAVVGRDALAPGGDPVVGTELLHLVGNVVFLAALVGLAVVVRARGPWEVRGLRAALAVQGLHVGEHVLLTVTTIAVGTPIGVTTAFGLLDPGPVLWSLRVLAHFAVNAAATIAAAVALLGAAPCLEWMGARVPSDGETEPTTAVVDLR